MIAKWAIPTSIVESDPGKDVENGDAPPINHEEGPDGGYGWLVIFGAFCVQVTSFGVISSWGKNRVQDEPTYQ